MTDTEKYVMECISKWVWSGFNDPDDVREMMEDILEPDCDADRLEGFIDSLRIAPGTLSHLYPDSRSDASLTEATGT